MPKKLRTTQGRRKPGRKLSGIRPSECKNFTGYRPCFPDVICVEKCQSPSPRGTKILLINLEAMGNVLLATTLLKPLKRKFPVSTIYWITLGNAGPLLEMNPFVEKVFIWEPENWMRLQAMDFDIVINLDKSTRAGAFVKSLTARKKLGYGIDGNGCIIPLNREATYNYRLGLDDNLKFRVNQKSASQLLAEAVALHYQRDEYVFNLSVEELNFCRQYREELKIGERLVVGFNTGCSILYPNKKMTLDQHVLLIEQLSKRENIRLLLLGGPEDTVRNAEIMRRVGGKVISTPTTEGVRRGVCYINLCDLIISGDSFGMHAAIALKKHVLVWFGVSCPQEIDLFGRGMKFVPEGLSCSPCWKKACPYNLECIQMIDLDGIVRAVDEFISGRITDSLPPGR